MAVAEALRDFNKLVRDEIGNRSADAILGANPFVGLDPTEMMAAASRLIGRALLRPELLAERTRKLAGDLGRVAAGNCEVEPAAADRRFADPTWRGHPLYRRWMQAYLVCVQTLHEIVGEVGFDQATAQRAEFAVTLLTEALAPTNFLIGNPAALKRAFETGGASLLRGARNWLGDLRRNGGMPAQVDNRPFKVARRSRLLPAASCIAASWSS